jgi:hypothetical protein
MPELEVDGSPKVELIVGRRLISDGNDANANDDSVVGEGRPKKKEDKHHAGKILEIKGHV